MTRSNELLPRIASLVLRSVLLLAGLVFGLALLVAGLIAALGVLLWSLLRGRRPELPLHWRVFRAAASRSSWSGAAGRPPAREDADVVDVEVREIATPTLPRQR